MGQTRDFSKKIGDTKETFHAKDKNGKDLTEAEEIKKRWQEYTEELHKNYTKKLITQITMMVWSLTQSQEYWSMKSSGPQEALL